MDSPDLRSALSSVVGTMRKATRLVQLAPFVYIAFFSMYMLLGWSLPEGALCIVDSMLSVSPSVTAALLVASRLFKLCPWHRAACLIPMTGHVETYVDSYIVTFTQSEIILINAVVGILTLAFIIRAFKHFFYGR